MNNNENKLLEINLNLKKYFYPQSADVINPLARNNAQIRLLNEAASFIDDLAVKCEQQLLMQDFSLDEAEIQIKLLESRVFSLQNQYVQQNEPVNHLNFDGDVRNDTEIDQNDDDGCLDQSKADESPSFDPRYEKFIKLHKIGASLTQIEMQLKIDGLDVNEFHSLITQAR